MSVVPIAPLLSESGAGCPECCLDSVPISAAAGSFFPLWKLQFSVRVPSAPGPVWSSCVVCVHGSSQEWPHGCGLHVVLPGLCLSFSFDFPQAAEGPVLLCHSKECSSSSNFPTNCGAGLFPGGAGGRDEYQSYKCCRPPELRGEGLMVALALESGRGWGGCSFPSCDPQSRCGPISWLMRHEVLVCGVALPSGKQQRSPPPPSREGSYP